MSTNTVQGRNPILEALSIIERFESILLLMTCDNEADNNRPGAHSYTGVKTLLICRQVCKSWHSVIDKSPILQRALYRRKDSKTDKFWDDQGVLKNWIIEGKASLPANIFPPQEDLPKAYINPLLLDGPLLFQVDKGEGCYETVVLSFPTVLNSEVLGIPDYLGDEAYYGPETVEAVDTGAELRYYKQHREVIMVQLEEFTEERYAIARLANSDSTRMDPDLDLNVPLRVACACLEASEAKQSISSHHHAQTTRNITHSET